MEISARRRTVVVVMVAKWVPSLPSLDGARQQDGGLLTRTSICLDIVGGLHAGSVLPSGQLSKRTSLIDFEIRSQYAQYTEMRLTIRSRGGRHANARAAHALASAAPEAPPPNRAAIETCLLPPLASDMQSRRALGADEQIASLWCLARATSSGTSDGDA
jgi:hypothetical protein